MGYTETKPAARPESEWEEATRIMTEEIRRHGRPMTGWFAGGQVLLLTTVGARSGAARMAPLAYTRDGDRYVVTASKGGAPTHPGWYHNLVADPIATIEVDREKFQARASVADGAERQRLWDQHIAVHPGIGEYPKKTTRVIPVVVLERVA